MTCMTVRMRHTRSHTKNRRSHHSLSEPRLSVCSQCKEYHLRHRACLKCGQYRGKEVIDVSKKIEKKMAKTKAKETK